ncbi:MAG: rod shape-determining protein MreC [Jatrophihabitantaceae bacterium]
MRRLTRRQRLAAIVLAVVALGFFTLDLGGGSLRSSHSGVRGALGSLYRGTDALLGPVRRFVQGLPTAGSNQSTISALQHENAQLRGQLAATVAERNTHTQLAKLQLDATNGQYRIVPARVIALGPGEGFEWTVTLDAGRSSGIRAGQSITDGDGLVGRVLYADSASSVALLAADPGSGVGVRDVRDGELGMARGDGTSGFRFVPLDPAAKVAAGDRLVTGPSGSTSFVPGLSVGTVTSVRTGADGTVQASVAPTSPPGSLDLVGVILVGGHANPPRPALQPAPLAAPR